MAELRHGAAVAGYRIEAVLGHGSMGTVYSAEEASLARRVALKILTPDLARDDRFRERFLHESRLAASLEHPHIVPIHAAGEADGVLYLAMRYVDGRDLAALLESVGRLEPGRALAIVDQVGSALDAAHARGLVHRDVKPGNILLARHGAGDDYAYLADFGLAKHASTVSSLTGNRAIVGTVDYLAPEQIEGRPLDGRADVYALGCVLYECIAGVPPFRRANELAALLAHVNDEPPPITERRPELPSALDDVLAKALAKDRERRYSTCAELVEAAGAALRGEDLPELPVVEPQAPAIRTFLFADVRGYTKYTREHGDEAGAALAASFAAAVRELAPEHTGALQELRGDEALVVFDSARRALQFAVALQAAVAEHELARPVGIGLDAGEAVPMEEGFRGGPLNRAARLCALAGPREVLASEAVRELAGATDGVAYGLHRVERLKGFAQPVRVVEVHPAETAPRRELKRRVTRALRGSRPRLRAAIAAVSIVVVVGIVLPLVLFGGARKASASILKAGTVGLVDAKTLKPVGSFDRLGAPDLIWRDPSGQLWTLDFATNSLARVDPRNSNVTAHIPLGIDLGGVAFGEGSVWVADNDAPAVNRYDPQYGTLTTRIRLPAKGLSYPDITSGVAFGGGSLWVAYGKFPFRLARVDPNTEHVLRTWNFSDARGQALVAYGSGSVWVVSQDTGRIWRIDPSTNSVVARAKLHGGWVQDIAIVDGYAWLPVQGDGAVWKVDGNGTVLKSIPTGDVPGTLGSSGNDVFVANANSASISRINALTDAVTTVRVGHSPQSATVADGRLWISLAPSTSDATRGLAKATTAEVSVVDDAYFNTDPALRGSQATDQLQEAVGARLLRYPDVAQPGGATLLPEIADLPTISNGGRTYTFHIRTGYRFSPPSGAPVTVDVVRYSIERALSPKLTDPGAQGFNLVGDIVGLDAYRAGKTPHISGIRVSGDDLSITLRRAAPDFPGRISLPFFTVVPLGTPELAHGVGKPIPSAGPYYISANVRGTLVLKRNPSYEGPRPRRLGAIVIHALAGTGAPQTVAANKSDYSFRDVGPWPPSLAAGGDLDRSFGPRSAAARAGHQRYFYPAMSAIRFFDFNSRSGIFRDPKIRRAVNYALDRKALAAATADRPFADLIPPGVPGAGGPTIYPLTGPDLARARVLMHGRRGRAVLFMGTPGTCSYCSQIGNVLRHDLARIGIQLQIRAFDDQYGAAAKTGAHWDLLLDGWYLDYVDPGDFVNVLTGAGPSIGYGIPPWVSYGDTGYLKRIRAAYDVTGPGRASLYRRITADMFRHSPPVAVYAEPEGPPQIFSSRIGCEVFRPQDGGFVDLAALCIRSGA